MPVGDDAPPRVLLVEGRDDERVVSGLRRRIAAMPDFGVIDKNGINNLLSSLEGEINAPGRTVVGILADANDSPSNRWRAVRDRLARLGVDVPADPDPSGTIIEGNSDEGRPRVGVWLMPDNESRGELEDFVAAMIPEDDPVWPLSGAYIEGIPEPYRKFTPGKTRRAEVHAWLAARERPRLMGVAIGARDLDVDAAGCKSFVDWLRRLFREREN